MDKTISKKFEILHLIHDSNELPTWDRSLELLNELTDTNKKELFELASGTLQLLDMKINTIQPGQGLNTDEIAELKNLVIIMKHFCGGEREETESRNNNKTTQIG